MASAWYVTCAFLFTCFPKHNHGFAQHLGWVRLLQIALLRVPLLGVALLGVTTTCVAYILGKAFWGFMAC